MSLSRTVYESIQREYDELRLKNERAAQEKRELIEARVPALKEIREQLASLYVKQAKSRLDGNREDADAAKEKIGQLLSEKESLLSRNGFSEKDLQPDYSCPLCHDTGYLEKGEMCSCFRAKIIDRLFENSHIRDVLEKENFDTFDLSYYDASAAVTSSGKTARAFAGDALGKAKDYVSSFDLGPSNLYIFGDTGVGKTFLTNCIAKEILSKGRSVVYISAVRFFDILADSKFGRAGEDDISAKLLMDCDLLIIDDLGTEITNSLTQTGLFNCVNERYLRGKHTIISSNLSVENLKTMYSERVFSRIMSNYKIIKLFGDDIRIKKALEV